MIVVRFLAPGGSLKNSHCSKDFRQKSSSFLAAEVGSGSVFSNTHAPRLRKSLGLTKKFELPNKCV